MRKDKVIISLIFLFTILSVSGVYADVIFKDDFENGLGNWTTVNSSLYLFGFLISDIGTAELHPPYITPTWVERACPGNFSVCGPDNANDYVYLFRTANNGPPLLYANFSTLGYNNVKVRYFLQTMIESSFGDFQNLGDEDYIQIVYRIGDSGPWTVEWQFKDPELYWTQYEEWFLNGTIPKIDNKPEVQIGFTFSLPDDTLELWPGDHFFIDDFQLLGDPIPFCGDGQIDSGESCELPSTNDNSYCSQTITACSGFMTGTRDLFGNCNSACGCVEDNFIFQCVQGNCGAECDTNDDCQNTECDNSDGCYNGTYRNYNDIVNTCQGDCLCTDNLCTDYTEITTDNDNDGYDTECDLDCDDFNPNINSGATEIPCNDMDEDCDGQDLCYPCYTNDDDNDGICNENDLCNNSSQEKVDQRGCTNIQFCAMQNQCGRGCDLADWKNNEPLVNNPHDCVTVLIHKGGKLYPACAGLSCAN